MAYYICDITNRLYRTSEKSEECITIDLATVFDHQPQEVALKKWAKSIQFIPLQTNDSILIKYISRIIKHGDKLLVQHDNRASVFDLAGKYLYDIGKQGGGPMSLVVYPTRTS